MSFQLSPDADNTKIFLVNLSEVGGRLDPNFIKKSRLLKSILANSQFSFQGFGNYIKNIQYGISQLANTEQKGVPIIRMNNLQGDEWNFLDLKHIELTGKELNLYRVNKGDLLFNRTNSKELVGKCGVFREEGDWGFASYLIRVQIDEKKLLPDFASTFLRLPVGRLQIDGLSRQIIGMTNINAEEIKLLQIPIVPLDFQKQVVSRMDAAYDAKKQKEEEAQRLLDSIDDYLLSELGINLPEPEENTIQNRIFYRKLSDVSGNRFDCNYNSKITLLLSQESKYKISHLKNLLVKSPQYGANEIAIHKNSVMETTYIRITDIDDFGYLKKDDLKTASTIEDQYILNKNDLLFARSGSVGRCYLHQDDTNKSIFAGYLIRFILNPEIANHYYIFYYCHSKIYKMWVDAVSRSAVQSNINSEEYKFLPIFLPPLEKQLEIVDRITTIRTQAKQLRQAAAAELEQAKQEVEAMILGERGNKA